MSRPPRGRHPAHHRDLPVDPDLPEPWRGRRRLGWAAVVAVAAGGVAGALLRYAVQWAWPTPTGAFPWAVLAINVSGSLALGALLPLVARRPTGERLVRPLVGTGFIGAYTTFSTFAVEIVDLVRDGHPVTATAYAAASLAGGLAAVVVGTALSQGRRRLRTVTR